MKTRQRVTVPKSMPSLPSARAARGRPLLWALFLTALFPLGVSLFPLAAAHGPVAVIAASVPFLALMALALIYAGRALVGGGRVDHALIIIGKNARTADYLRTMRVMADSNVHLLGVLDVAADDFPSEAPQRSECQELMDELEVPVLGTVESLTQVLSDFPADEVLVTLPIKSFYDEIGSCLAVCQEAGVPVSLSTDFFGLDSTSPSLVSWGDSGTRINYVRSPYPRWQLVIKRAVDILGSGFGLLLFGVPMLLIAGIIKLTSKGPVFFVQERAGLNHRTFKLLKFRTMVTNAEELRKNLDHLNEQEGPVFKIKNDPRITRIGRFLRRYSLDELPQLINVLIGDMSLVGPRPPIPAEVREYEWWQRRRLSIRPGLTCYWQVSGRNEITFEDWMKMDLRYIDNWSPLVDLKLILLTIPTMIRGSGM